jgi:hypothetical protein
MSHRVADRREFDERIVRNETTRQASHPCRGIVTTFDVQEESADVASGDIAESRPDLERKFSPEHKPPDDGSL